MNLTNPIIFSGIFKFIFIVELHVSPLSKGKYLVLLSVSCELFAATRFRPPFLKGGYIWALRVNCPTKCCRWILAAGAVRAFSATVRCDSDGCIKRRVGRSGQDSQALVMLDALPSHGSTLDATSRTLTHNNTTQSRIHINTRKNIVHSVLKLGHLLCGMLEIHNVLKNR